MKKVEKYTGEKTYMYPTGKIATPEVVKADYPAVTAFTFVVTTDEAAQTIYGLNSLSSLRSFYNIDSSLSDDEAIAAIEEAMNTPEPVVEPEPSAEERIAAALEYQVMSSMPDEEIV